MSDSGDNINISFTVTSDQAEAGADQASSAITDSVKQIQQQMERLIASSQQSTTAITRGFDAMGASIQGVAARVNSSVRAVAGVVDDYGNEVVAASRRVTAANAQVTQSNRQVADSHDRAGHAAGGVSRELVVLAHELAMGNYKRFGGSMMVLAEQFDFLHFAMTPIGGMLTLIGGAIAVVGLAAAHGAIQMSELRDSLILTGDYAGITTGQFIDMGNKIASDTGVKITSVRTALAAVAGSGRFTGEALEPVAVAVAKIGQFSSASAEEVVKSFEGMSDGVYKWAVKYNESYHFATDAQLEHIRTLEMQGDKERAEAQTADLVVAKINETATQLGYLPGLWHEAAAAASSAWDAMMNWGRPSTLESRIADLKKSIAEGTDGMVNVGAFQFRSSADAQAQLRRLEQQRDQQQAAAGARAASERVQNEGTAAVVAMRSEWKGLGGDVRLADQEVQRFRDSIAAAQKAAKDSGTSVAPDIQRMIDTQPQIEAAIRKKYDTKDFKQPRGQVTVGNQYAQVNAESQAQVNLTKERLKEETDELDRAYKAQQVSLQSYYSRRLQITLQGMDAETAVVRQQLQQTQALEGAAKTPQERLSMKVKEIELNGRLAVMETQRTDAIRKSAQEEAAATNEQVKALQDLATKRAEVDATEAQRRGIVSAQAEVAAGRMTQEQLLQLEITYEQQRTAAAVAALRARLDTERTLTIAARQQIEEQIYQLQQDSMTKQLQLSTELSSTQQAAAKTATDAIENDFSRSFANVVTGTEKARTAFTSFITSIDQTLTQLVAKQLFQQLFNMNSGAGGMSAGGLLTSALSSLFGGFGSTSFSSAGAFGFSTGLAGTTGAVTAGLGSVGDSAGLSSLMGLASFDVGTPYVPHDMVAQIHQGEAIVPAHLNSPYNPGNSTITNQFILPNMVDSRTQSQIAAMAGSAIQRALQRNG